VEAEPPGCDDLGPASPALRPLALHLSASARS
jgi:hypothetical protein